MAKIIHCTLNSRARVHRLVSSKQAYEFQYAYHGRKCCDCGEAFIYWQGEYPNGTRTELFPVPSQEHQHWLRRIQAGEAKPEAQLMSEYSRRIAGYIDGQIQYQTKLCQAHRWYKGDRVDAN
jgi:hypothetical protein